MVSSLKRLCKGGPSRLTDFDAEAFQTDDENSRMAHLLHCFSTKDVELPGVQALVELVLVRAGLLGGIQVEVHGSGGWGVRGAELGCSVYIRSVQLDAAMDGRERVKGG